MLLFHSRPLTIATCLWAFTSESEARYRASLSDLPLLSQPGETITIDVEYSYIADTANYRIQKFSTTGRWLTAGVH